jgi:hypothetical protein
MTIVQPNLEIPVLTNKIISVPQLPDYTPDVNPAPLSREIIGGLLDKLVGVGSEDEDMETPRTVSTTDLTSPRSTHLDGPTSPETPIPSSNPAPSSILNSTQISSLYPTLPPQLADALIAETVYAIAAIGGHDNPPARHIVGFEGVVSVKEKLKTVSEELEDFVEVSCGVDIGKEGGLGFDGGDDVGATR